MYYLKYNRNIVKPVLREEFEDTKGVIINRKWKKARQHKEKGQTTIYKTLHRTLKIEQHQSTENPGEHMC